MIYWNVKNRTYTKFMIDSEWIKNHFLSNQCYGVYEDIVTMACHAWNQLSQNVDLVKSIMYRDWINIPR
jgi:hypothetical protein